MEKRTRRDFVKTVSSLVGFGALYLYGRKLFRKTEGSSMEFHSLSKKGNLLLKKINQKKFLSYSFNTNESLDSVIERFCSFKSESSKKEFLNEVSKESYSSLRKSGLRIPFEFLRAEVKEVLEGNSFSHEVDAGESSKLLAFAYSGSYNYKELEEINFKLSRLNGITNHNVSNKKTIDIPYSFLSKELKEKFVQDSASGNQNLVVEMRKRFKLALIEKQREFNSFSQAKKSLSQLYLLLDAGHGEYDSGTFVNGLKESDFTHGFLPVLAEEFKKIGVNVIPIVTPTHVLMSNSKVKMVSSRKSIETRRNAINHYDKYLTNQGIPFDKKFFLSIHANSSGSNSTGALMIIPGTKLNEAKNKYKTRKSSELLAKKLVSSFSEYGWPVDRTNKNGPIQTYTYDKDGIYLPGILQGEITPVLIELGNMYNQEDFSRLTNKKALEDVAAPAIAHSFLSLLELNFSKEHYKQFKEAIGFF